MISTPKFLVFVFKKTRRAETMIGTKYLNLSVSNVQVLVPHVCEGP